MRLIDTALCVHVCVHCKCVLYVCGVGLWMCVSG